MVASQIVGVTSQPRMTPYISVDMFKHHRRRGVQVDNLVPRGTPDQQDAALAEVIESASVWADNLILQILAATQDTVLDTVNIDRRGYATIHPRYRPVIALTAFAIGPSPNQLQTYTDLTGAGVQPNRITVPTAPFALTTSQGPLQFGTVPAPHDRAWCQYTYQNGFPVTTLTAPAAAGATSIAVADTTGIVAGQTYMTIYDLQRRFRFLASTVSTAPTGVGTGPGTVTCPALPYAIPNSGNYPTMVSALPADAIEAIVLATRAIIKETGGGNPRSSSRSAAQAASEEPNAGDDFAEAQAILHPYFVPVE